MKKGEGNFYFKPAIVFSVFLFIFIVGISIVSATFGYACVNCQPNQELTTTTKCGDFNENGNVFEVGENVCLNGKNFAAGYYDWKLRKENQIISSGKAKVDSTQKFCLKVKTQECGEYEINFEGLIKKYYINCDDDPPSCTSQTIVGGTIYQNTIENRIEGAEVWVICNEYQIYAISGADGTYSVNFDCSQCSYGDSVSVYASKNGLTGENFGKIDMTSEISENVTLDVGIINVPLVPEFGTIIAVLTAISALGVFFVIRKK